MVLSVLLMVGMIVISGYYLFFYEPVPIEDLSDKFCTCAKEKEVTDSKYVMSRENFTYASKIYDCFGDEFRTYKEGLTERQRETFIMLILERINEKCPVEAGAVFR